MKYTLLILLFSIARLFLANQVDSSYFDLSKSDFSKSTATLDGDWDYCFECSFDNFKKEESIKVPGYWNAKSNGSHQVFGQSCYRTKIKIPQQNKRLALRVDNVHNAYKLWINGKLVYKKGNTSLSKENQIADWSPSLIPLDLDTNIFELVFEVSNFGHRNSGIASSIYIGAYDQMIKDRDFFMAMDAFIIGGLFILGLFLFSMYLLWESDTSLLYFLGFTLFFGTWLSFRDEKVFYSIWSEFNWEFALRIEYASLIICTTFFIGFISNLFPKQNIKLVQKTAYIYNSISLILIITFPTYIFTYTALSNIFLLITLMIYVSIIFIKANRTHEFDNLFTSISLLFLFLLIGFQVVDFLSLFKISRTLIDLLSIGFVLSLALIFADRFTEVFNSVVFLKDKAEKQQLDLEIKNNEITASIQYAKQLQSTILPTKEEITIIFKNYFIYYQPKDIVSGDFYWMEEKDNIIYFAVADCTGHGVPGAMVSFVCSNVLSQVVLDENINSPERILDRTRELVIRRFSTSETSLNDGMDISLASYNTKSKILKWAGANNPLYIIKKQSQEILEIKGHKQPIGSYAAEEKPFSLHQFSMEKGDRIYLFSDGYIDQFGGPKGKKYKTNHFKEFILSVQEHSIQEQENLFTIEFNKWRGDKFQIDDVSVCGLEF